MSSRLLPLKFNFLVTLSLVKMVYKIAEERRREPRWPEVEHAIKRNFGGLDEIEPVKFFKKQFALGGSQMV